MDETEETVEEICKQLAWKKEKEQGITKKRGAIGSRKGGRSGQSLKKALTENWLTTCSTSSKKAISRH